MHPLEKQNRFRTKKKIIIAETHNLEAQLSLNKLSLNPAQSGEKRLGDKSWQTSSKITLGKTGKSVKLK